MIEKAINIAIREWDDIRRSPEKCRDIGELAPEVVYCQWIVGVFMH